MKVKVNGKDSKHEPMVLFGGQGVIVNSPLDPGQEVRFFFSGPGLGWNKQQASVCQERGRNRGQG